ncbi:MAG: hypothetical protein JXR86_07885 [Spirochaetales bacterium]|nr:hypothetical protein [Spirochaetales bacterium]
MKQGKSTKQNGENEVRPEELIVNIYRDKLRLQERGRKPRRVVMPMDLYRKIRNYHAGLGEIQGSFSDYITEDEIFGIPVFIDNIEGISVE